QDLCAWRLGRCLFVGDAGLYSADNLAALSRGLGRYILAVPMRKLKDIELEVLTRQGRYKQVADNLQVKEIWVGDGERRKTLRALPQSARGRTPTCTSRAVAAPARCRADPAGQSRCVPLDTAPHRSPRQALRIGIADAAGRRTALSTALGAHRPDAR